MHFKLELILKQGCDPGFEMGLDDADLPALVVRFSRVSDEKDKRYGSCLCTALTQITPQPKITGLLESVPKPMPKSLLDFADSLEGRLVDAATRALKLLDWFRGSCDVHNPIGLSKGLTYSPDAVQWRKLPRTLKLNFTIGFPELIMTDKSLTPALHYPPLCTSHSRHS